MRVLTFGWDFPPARNGGLGVACFGLTRELAREGVDVVFVLPKRQRTIGTPRFIFADNEYLARAIEVPGVSMGAVYRHSSDRVESLLHIFDEFGNRQTVTRTILEEVRRFAKHAARIAADEPHDIIHAHDWSSYLAGVAAKLVSGKPLILHVHATSFDQAASDNVDPEIFSIEKEGFHHADSIVTVSQFTKDILVNKHGVRADKITVIHNGCDVEEPPRYEPTLSELKAQGYRIVLYHGRITIQKGVEFFVRAARKIIDYDSKVVFVISGWGDKKEYIMNLVGELGLSKHFIFAGSLWEEERDRMYQSADLVVMPSVSEPFGLVPLEALQHGTPSLVSKQSGVTEVITHILKVDFWDIDEMANQIISALRYEPMRQQMVAEGKQQMHQISWRNAAGKVVDLYRSLLQYITP